MRGRWRLPLFSLALSVVCAGGKQPQCHAERGSHRTNDEGYAAYLSRELPGEPPLSVAGTRGPSAEQKLTFFNHVQSDTDPGEIMKRDWIAEPYEAAVKAPEQDSLNEMDVISAYLRATTNSTVTQYLTSVLLFLQRTFGIGSIVWGIKQHHSLVSTSALNPLELYLYNDHPKWRAALSPPVAILHALSRFYPDAARWVTALRHSTDFLLRFDAPCRSTCTPGKRFVNHMTGIELPQTADGALDTVEFIESCKPKHPQPRATWVNHVHVLNENGTCRPKNTYYHVRQSIEEGWYLPECANPKDCHQFSTAQMIEKVVTALEDYAAYHSWNPAVLPKVLPLILSDQILTRNAWTIAHKSKMKSLYHHPVRHSIYNYGIGALDTAAFAKKYGFQRLFVEWMYASESSLKHILFDVSVDFVINANGDDIQVVGAAIGGGSL